MANPNTAKWKLYADQQLLYAGAGSGQNLNDDLQKNIANELDRLLVSAYGDAVIGESSFLTTVVSGLQVSVAAGSALIQGQKVYKSGSTTLTLTANKVDLKIYVKLDSGGFNLTTSTWPTTVNFIDGSLPSDSILLATVTTGASTITSVTDLRPVYNTPVDIQTVTDTLSPADTARSVRQRFNMVLNRIRDIIGTTGSPTWKDAIPASLTSLFNKFNATTGHKHSGAANDAPKLDSSIITFTPTVGSADTPVAIGITAADVSGALSQLDTRKLDINGSRPMSGFLTLSGDPSLDLHAATMRFVVNHVSTQIANRAPQMASATINTLASIFTTVTGASTSTFAANNISLLPAPISLTAKGGVVQVVCATGPIKIAANFTQAVANSTGSTVYHAVRCYYLVERIQGASRTTIGKILVATDSKSQTALAAPFQVQGTTYFTPPDIFDKPTATPSSPVTYSYDISLVLEAKGIISGTGTTYTVTQLVNGGTLNPSGTLNPAEFALTGNAYVIEY